MTQRELAKEMEIECQLDRELEGNQPFDPLTDFDKPSLGDYEN